MAGITQLSTQQSVRTPSFGRRPGVDRIDEIIEDTDKALRGLASNLPPTGPDPKALKDAFLETSPYFQEMLQALEAFDAAAGGGSAVASKYEQAFFAALRTMLRECLFTKNAGLRKHHIDRVFAWFTEKRSRTSQATTGSGREASSTGKHLVSAATPSAPRRPAFASARAAQPFMSGPRPSTAPVSGSRHVAAAEDEEAPGHPGAAASHAGLAPGEEGPHGLSRIPIKERIKEYKMRNLRVSQMRRAGIPLESIKKAQEAVQKMRPKSTSFALEGLAIDDEMERKVNELWLRKREEEEQERRSEEEVKEAMAWWAHNRARIEEEVTRRQESIRFASKTAILHSRPATAAMQGTRTQQPKDLDDTIPTDSDEDEEGVDVVEDLMQLQQLPEKFQKVPQLRSPYDGLRQAATPAGWRQDSPARPISARLAGFDRGGGQLLGSPMGSGSLSLSRSAERPQTAGARVSAYDDTLGTLSLGKAADAAGLHGFSSPHSRPFSARLSSATTRAGGGLDSPARGRGGGVGSSRPSSAYSGTQRVLQLSEVDRVKRAFAKTRIPCPLSTLEKALVVPEDRSYATCVQLLPRPRAGLIHDPILAEKKKSGKGDKGKKGKKGKKKK